MFELGFIPKEAASQHSSNAANKKLIRDILTKFPQLAGENHGPNIIGSEFICHFWYTFDGIHYSAYLEEWCELCIYIIPLFKNV